MSINCFKKVNTFLKLCHTRQNTEEFVFDKHI